MACALASASTARSPRRFDDAYTDWYRDDVVARPGLWRDLSETWRQVAELGQQAIDEAEQYDSEDDL